MCLAIPSKIIEIKEGLATIDVDGVIRKVSAPVRREGGIAILTGNLAPGGAVVKQSGVDPKMFTFRGKASVRRGSARQERPQ